jgi:hypothetical protein
LWSKSERGGGGEEWIEDYDGSRRRRTYKPVSARRLGSNFFESDATVHTKVQLVPRTSFIAVQFVRVEPVSVELYEVSISSFSFQRNERGGGLRTVRTVPYVSVKHTHPIHASYRYISIDYPGTRYEELAILLVDSIL